MFLLAVIVLLAFSAHDYWTERPQTLFEQLLDKSITPGRSLEDSIPSLLERGYSCVEILRTIAEVRWFIREHLLKVPENEVGTLVASRLAEERKKRSKEAEERLKLKKPRSQQEPSHCP